MGCTPWSWKRSVKRKSDARYWALSVLLIAGFGYFGYTELKGDVGVQLSSRRLLVTEFEKAVGDYPEDIFTESQLKKGAVVLHFLGMMYMFLALAIVCDEFFVPALERITKGLKIKDDVAGATFMAAGGSAPELATSIIGAFTNSSVGFGTIVGSAVFNVLFVIGMCSLFSKEVLTLTWWPLTRDVTFYTISLGVLAAVFSDEKIKIWEALILMGIYLSYVTFMAYNEEAYKMVSDNLRNMGLIKDDPVKDEKLVKTATGGFVKARTLWKVSIYSAMAHAEKQKLIIEREVGNARFKTVGKAVLMDNRFQKMKDDLRKSSGIEDTFRIIQPVKPVEEGSSKSLEHNISFQANVVEHALHPDVEGKHAHSFQSPNEANMGATIVERGLEPGKEETDNGTAAADDDNEPLDLSCPKGFFPIVFYIISFPLLFLLVFTIPDTRKPRFQNWYMISFLLSIAWIGVFSYLMVWWATVIGAALGIPNVVMGLTFLAAGTSVPDLLTSVIVARQGQGDMAVSSSIGSNLFDVCIGLPLPWFLYIVTKGEDVEVKSDSLLLSVLVLFAMLIAVIATIALSKWKMTKCMGFTMFGLYVVFLVQALLAEFLDFSIDI